MAGDSGAGGVAMSDDSAFTAALYANELAEYSFDLAALRRWMIAFVVCDFNVDVGVEVEYMFPSTALSAADIQNICFSSFPERTNSDTIEDSAFHFKFRHTSHDVAYGVSEDDDAHWYGYCLFRQQRDASAKRNYRQKALTLVSQHDFPPLFGHIVQTICGLDFEVSPTLLESACSNIAAWCAPQIGARELPFLGQVLEVFIPPHPAFPLQGLVTASSSRTDLRVEYKEIHTSEPVGSWARLAQMLTSLSELYIIFERALLADPIVVLAEDPQTCSEFVSSIVDMIRPIMWGGDVRPYLTMQSDFCMGAHESMPLRHYLIGITNPFLLKRLLSSGKENSNAHVVYLGQPEVKRKHLSFSMSYADRDRRESVLNNDSKGVIVKDLVFLRKLQELLKDPTVPPGDVTRLVRRHFALLSAFFLAPLNRYLATLTSHGREANSIDIASFNEDDFLASLAKHGSSIPFKGKTAFHRQRNSEQFYRKFCRSSNFYTWMEMKLRLQSAETGSGRMTPSAVLTPEKA